MFQLDLSPSGNLQLHLPTGRALEIEPSTQGLSYILRILVDHKKGLRNQKGYVKNFPTQHNIEQWMKKDRKEKADKLREETQAKFGVDISGLEINL